MILDRIERLPMYGEFIPGAAKIAEAFAADCGEMAPCEVREKAYELRSDEKRRFEVHFQTIDLMMMISGGEEIAICPHEMLEMAEALPNGGDGCKLNGAPCGTRANVQAGYFCAIYPGEAHMVGGKIPGMTQVKKWVVKVPCPEAMCLNKA